MTIEMNFFKHAADVKTFAAGTTILEEGAPGDVMYGVQSGVVDIIYQGHVINTVEVGGVFGEMALLDHKPRSASAVANTDCTVVPVDRKRFMFMVQENPVFALMVMQTLSDRIRKIMEHS